MSPPSSLGVSNAHSSFRALWAQEQPSHQLSRAGLNGLVSLGKAKETSKPDGLAKAPSPCFHSLLTPRQLPALREVGVL